MRPPTTALKSDLGTGNNRVEILQIHRGRGSAQLHVSVMATIAKVDLHGGKFHILHDPNTPDLKFAAGHDGASSASERGDDVGILDDGDKIVEAAVLAIERRRAERGDGLCNPAIFA